MNFSSFIRYLVYMYMCTNFESILIIEWHLDAYKSWMGVSINQANIFRDTIFIHGCYNHE
jgi:hypothetical protein